MKKAPMTLWVVMAVLVAAATIVVVWARRDRGGTLVLGQQLADAQAREAARLASGADGPSPMPKGEYDEDAGDYDLAAVTERPLDRELQGLVRRWKDWPPERRAKARGRIGMDEQYTLVQFAKRCSVLSLKERSVTRSEDGLLALAMIDETRIDPRDVAWAFGLLGHAIEAEGVDGRRLVSGVAALATPGMAEILTSRRGTLSQWGYTEIRTENGVGLVSSGFAKYEPTIDMTGLALRLAANLQRGRYIARPELATEVPAAWFAKAHRATAEQSLKKARAAISIQGTLRKGHTTDPLAQMFVQWVAELPTAQEAAALVRCVGTDAGPDGRYVIGVASGRLFSLLVAGSAHDRVDAFETPESLASIAENTRAVLQEVSR